MAALDSAYRLFAALDNAEDLSLVAQSVEIRNVWAAFANATSIGKYLPGNRSCQQLVQHLEQRNLLRRGASAAKRQLQLVTQHLHAAAQVKAVKADALKQASLLLLTLDILPKTWLDKAAKSGQSEGAVGAKMHRELVDAGLIPALGEAMSAAAATLRSLVQEQQQQQQQNQQQQYLQLQVLDYVLALVSTWRCMIHGVQSEFLLDPWPPTYVACASLNAALLEAVTVFAAGHANAPGIAAAAAAAAACSAWTSSSRSRRGASTRQSSSSSSSNKNSHRRLAGNGTRVQGTQESGWKDTLQRAVTELKAAGIRLAFQLNIIVQYERHNPRCMSLLGSSDVLSVVTFAAACTAHSLHVAAGGKLPLPVTAGGRQQLLVPSYHDKLLQAMGSSLPALLCVSKEGDRANSQEAHEIVSGLRHLLLGPDAKPEVSACSATANGSSLAAMAAYWNVEWPPAAALTPQQQQQPVLLPLMQVVMELLLLLAPGGLPTCRQDVLLQGLELLQHLQPKPRLKALAGSMAASTGRGTSAASREGPHLPQHAVLLEFLQPFLLLGPVVVHAAEQHLQDTASRSWAIEVMQSYGQILSSLLFEVGTAEDISPIFAAQPLTAAATCEAALRVQLINDAPTAGSSSSRGRQAGRLMPDVLLAGLAGDLASLVQSTAPPEAVAAAVAAATPSSRLGRHVRGGEINKVPPQLLCLLISCLKVSCRVSAAVWGPWCAASQAGTVLDTALLLSDGGVGGGPSNGGSGDTAHDGVAAAAAAAGGGNGGSGEGSTAAPSLRQSLESGKVSWAILAARALICVGQALAQLTPWQGAVPAGVARLCPGAEGDGLHRQWMGPPMLLGVCERALVALGQQIKHLQSQLPAAEVDGWLQQSTDVASILREIGSKVADNSSSSSNSGSSSNAIDPGWSWQGQGCLECVPGVGVVIAQAGTLGRELQSLGRQVAAWLPCPHVCNNPTCETIWASAAAAAAAGTTAAAKSGLSEKALVSKARCSGCRLSKYCSKACQEAHWKDGHRAVCKLLQGGTGP